MRVETRTDIEYHLFLNAREASWLMTYLQNPIIENEDEHTAKMRELFFIALQDQGATP